MGSIIKMDDQEFLRPHIAKVGKRYYRKLAHFEGNTSENSLYDLDYGDHDEYDDEEEPEDRTESNIETTPGGYKICVDVPVDFIKFICGRKMENKLNIERETNTMIKMPRQGVEGPVVITGGTRKAVISCRHRIDIIVESSKQRLPPTHFVSFPLYNEEIIQRFEHFRDTAVEQCKKSKGLDVSIFVVPEKLHLTINVMVLLTADEVESAGSLLERCFEEVVRDQVGQRPLLVKLRGLDYMNDDPSKVDVLYAKVEEVDGSGRLQKVADEILKFFTSKGVAKPERGRVKLHATVINTRLKDNDQPDTTKSSKTAARPQFQRKSFDAREILEVFKDYEFGEHHVDCIHLSQRGVFDANGHYHCCKSVPLP